MKEFLLTWYGITDFRSSLGFEKSGPILGAIADGSYTDVIILGYTKHGAGIPEDEFEKELNLMQEIGLPDEKVKFTYDCANCSAAHKHFIKFIQSRALEMGKSLSITFIPVSLSQLNDSEGIYAASVHALQAVSDEHKDSLVSIFLSPGTPLMAFSWALAAFKFPSLKKRLIASSDPRKPPVPIMPPQEWLAWNSKKTPILKKEGENRFDVIYTLFGEQRIPAFWGIKQFETRKHIFITSANYDAECMKRFLPELCEFEQCKVNPYSPQDVFDKIIVHAERLPWDARIGFNLTGGTKLMYAGALNACRKLGGVPFYVGGKNLELVYLDDFTSEPLKPIEKVETFILLNSNGLGISNQGRSDAEDEESKKMTDVMWKSKKRMNRIYFEMEQMEQRKCYFELSLENPKEPELSAVSEGPFKISTKTAEYSFEDESQFLTYIKGGWFEEYIYNHLHPLYEKGELLDIRHGIKVDFDNNAKGNLAKHYDYQEIDVALTDGKRLFIIECKSGRAEIEQIEKLSTITRYYGGIEGCGILAYSKEPDSDIILKKVKETPNVDMVFGENIIHQIKKIIGCEND